jgi:anti-sigma B factor antagonist
MPLVSATDEESANGIDVRLVRMKTRTKPMDPGLCQLFVTDQCLLLDRKRRSADNGNLALFRIPGQRHGIANSIQRPSQGYDETVAKEIVKIAGPRSDGTLVEGKSGAAVPARPVFRFSFTRENVMEIIESRQNGIRIIELHGRLTLAEAPSLRSSLIDSLDDSAEYLLFDLHALDFIDSSGLSVFISLLKGVRGKGGEMVVARPSADVLSLFKLTHLHRAFEIFDQVHQGLEHLAGVSAGRGN